MGLLKDSSTFEKVITGFFKLVGDTPEVAHKLLASGLIIRFQYSDPEVVVLIDCSGEKLAVRAGDTETKAQVGTSMSSDIAHKFWFGKVNLMAALTRK